MSPQPGRGGPTQQPGPRRQVAKGPVPAQVGEKPATQATANKEAVVSEKMNTNTTQRPVSKDQIVPNGAQQPRATAPTMSWADRARQSTQPPHMLRVPAAAVRPAIVPGAGQPPVRHDQARSMPQQPRETVPQQVARPGPQITMPAQNPVMVPMHAGVVPPVQFGDIGPMDLQRVAPKDVATKRVVLEAVTAPKPEVPSSVTGGDTLPPALAPVATVCEAPSKAPQGATFVGGPAKEAVPRSPHAVGAAISPSMSGHRTPLSHGNNPAGNAPARPYGGPGAVARGQAPAPAGRPAHGAGQAPVGLPQFTSQGPHYTAYPYPPAASYGQPGWQASPQLYHAAYFQQYAGGQGPYPLYMEQQMQNQSAPGQHQPGGPRGPPSQGGAFSGAVSQQSVAPQVPKVTPVKREKKVLTLVDPSTNQAIDLSDVKPITKPGTSVSSPVKAAAQTESKLVPREEEPARKPATETPVKGEDAPASSVVEEEPKQAAVVADVTHGAPVEAATTTAPAEAATTAPADATTPAAAETTTTAFAEAATTAPAGATTSPAEATTTAPAEATITALAEATTTPPAEAATPTSSGKSEQTRVSGPPELRKEPENNTEAMGTSTPNQEEPAPKTESPAMSTSPSSSHDQPSDEEPASSEEVASSEEAEQEPRVYVPVPEGRKRYSKDALLSLRPYNPHPPPGFEPEAFALAVTRTSMPPQQQDGRGPSWSKGHRPGFHQGPHHQGGGPVPRAASMRGRPPPVAGPDSDMWQRGQALPPLPQEQRHVSFGGRSGRGGPAVTLHKTDSAYKVGAFLSEDPEEEKAQKALKSMLNKITPDNFDRIKGQIVGQIDERKRARTLQSFIDQIFDKALTEVNFSELYASLVKELKDKLPKLIDDNGEEVEFRRALLNKCQVEFEEGVVAMKAVAERELLHKDEDTAEETEESEEGEIEQEGEEPKLTVAEQRKAEREAAKREVEARKRMLGNIIFVGQLYCRGVLTEKVMHSCIQQLLDETEKPRPEDVECLSKLMTTVGNLLDHSSRMQKFHTAQGQEKMVSSKELMDMYFQRISMLSQNKALDSRHRFMLQDLIELRKNNWVLRRKAEGPKKIDDIHRDAEMEARRRAAMDRQPPRGMRDGPRGPPMRATFMDNRVEGPFRTMQRVSSQDSLGGNQSFRPHGRAPPAASRMPSRPVEKEPSKAPERAAVVSSPEPMENVSEEVEKEIIQAATTLLQEWESLHDEKEASLSLSEFLDKRRIPGRLVVDALLNAPLFQKGLQLEPSLQFLTSSFVREKLGAAHFQDGTYLFLSKLVDRLEDKPVAVNQTGELLGALIIEEILSFDELSQMLLKADSNEPFEEEDTELVDSGNAVKVMASLLKHLSGKEGPEAVKSRIEKANVALQKYLPSFERDDAASLNKVIASYQLTDVIA